MHLFIKININNLLFLGKFNLIKPTIHLSETLINEQSRVDHHFDRLSNKCIFWSGSTIIRISTCEDSQCK